MPQTQEIDYLDGEFSVQETEPSTIPECIELIGEAAVVDETTSNLRYRNKYPRVYKLVSKEVEGLGFARDVKETKVNKDKTERKVFISEMDHLRAFLKADESHRAILAELFNKIAPAQPLYVKGERTGGGGKISQAAMDAANAFFASDEQNEKAELIESMVPGYKLARDAEGNLTPESLARGIQALNKNLMKAAQQKALSALGAPGAPAAQ